MAAEMVVAADGVGAAKATTPADTYSAVIISVVAAVTLAAVAIPEMFQAIFLLFHLHRPRRR